MLARIASTIRPARAVVQAPSSAVEKSRSVARRPRIPTCPSAPGDPLPTEMAAPAPLRGASRASGRACPRAACCRPTCSSGVIEAHFHFFVTIGLLTLYREWAPFLLAIGYVVLHHGVMGVLQPRSVYSNPDAVAHPWRWALVHGAFVLAAGLTHIASWRTNEQQLLLDPLTGLPSRLQLMSRLQTALARLERTGKQVAVLFIDLDRFKVVNDSLGHHAGDRLLLAVTERLRKAVRRHELPARFGGDEFVLVCEDLADLEEAA